MARSRTKTVEPRALPVGRAVESLLSARLLLSPQAAGGTLFFISDLSGRLSLYSMPRGGGWPERLLPPDLALQNPKLLDGLPYVVFPRLKKILVMVDQDGDENYQPCFVPLEGGYPERVFGEELAEYKVACFLADHDRSIVYLQGESRKRQSYDAFQADLGKRTLRLLAGHAHECNPVGHSPDHRQVFLRSQFTEGDCLLQVWERGETRVLLGTPLAGRTEGVPVPLNGIKSVHPLPGGREALVHCTLFSDTYGLACLDLRNPTRIEPIPIRGVRPTGPGELEQVDRVGERTWLLEYGWGDCSHVFEAAFDARKRELRVTRRLVGTGALQQGVVQRLSHDSRSGDYALSFSRANAPAQLYTLEGRARKVVRHTDERVLGLPEADLSRGEDATYTSHDGLRIPARLYLPAESLGLPAPYPVVFYVHGGPHGQERPDFTWFSMPVIQALTLRGMAVFVPNVRGSHGYGIDFMSRVDRDWGGKDRLDHVHAHKLLAKDPRLDLARSGVMGRSYGGYMTLMLAGRHPELWRAACDLFGPYNLVKFMDRLPEAWKPHFHQAVGHPERDHDELVERSPSTYLPQLRCPLLVIQGKNDPRVKELESRDVVEELRAKGKHVAYLVFEDEGHDVLKYPNKVTCYREIVEFFARHLEP